MKAKAASSLHLLEPQQAIKCYLEDLFSETQAQPRESVAQPVAVTENSVAEMIQAEAMTRLLAFAPGLECAGDVASVKEALGPYEASVPLQAILLELGGLKLALPLQELNGILKFPSELSQIPYSAPWVLGIYPTGERNIRIVDSSTLLLPERYRMGIDANCRRDQHLVVLIGNGEWGLDCLAASEVIQLQPEQVSWRSDRSSRPWLAGTVRDHLCALVDCAAFVTWLECGAPDN